MTRELKLALIVGFTLVLVVTVLISDHLSKARQVKLGTGPTEVAAAPSQWPREVAEAPMTNATPGPLAAIPETKPMDAPTAGAPAASEPLVTRASDGMRVADAGKASEDVPTLRQGGSNDSLVSEIKARGGEVDPKTGNFRLPTAGRVDRVATESGTPGGGVPALTPAAGKAATKEAGKSAESITPGERTYTVLAGDSAFKIMQKFYGDGNQWRKLAEFNGTRVGKNGEVRSGQTLRIPTSEVLLGKATPKVKEGTKAAEPRLASAEKAEAKSVKAPEAGKAARTYVVQKGDSLGTIAKKTLGSSKKTSEILAANDGVLDDEDHVEVGMVLKIPG